MRIADPPQEDSSARGREAAILQLDRRKLHRQPVTPLPGLLPQERVRAALLLYRLDFGDCIARHVNCFGRFSCWSTGKKGIVARGPGILEALDRARQ